MKKIKDFINKYERFAELNETFTGVPKMLTLAQAALESGWGEHAPGNNFFGIKVGTSWKGETQELDTYEYIQGNKEKVKGLFRKYESPIESFIDHALLLKRRFPGCFNYKDPVKFAESMQTDYPYQYATDPAYAQKIGKIINMIEKENAEQS